ncbi:hypothetical protein B0T21DRAFT_321315 [Apiosordaria backusii]|uniref:Heterokaryon incompatibility domain-containing protein n=1 Tax=Apiosordaria backusii TaxID=314023 RepID=A0AA40DIZ7_9PEZI|nr:hypothetical protein B0T21DRAFT_321315 [Apiosordaria backusii]
MRLLDTYTLRLISKQGAIPPYAILSHTWGAEADEVSFQDINDLQSASHQDDHPVTRKTGFSKIHDAARVARSSDIKYIWIDTCCIDKTSSAELSEAINSMYRWYQDSTICYAFLNDVDDSKNYDSEFDNEEQQTFARIRNITRSVQRSRWFTRGWTLQELIAPPNVIFYSRNWNVLGTKLKNFKHSEQPLYRPSTHEPLDFATLVSEITGVEVDVLSGYLDMDSISVAGKMKWAARRQTTRTEDMAYCLMGLFKVNMPLLYGEGHRAFMRLQEEIIKVTNDQSIFCWQCNEADVLQNHFSGLLASRPAYFESFGDIRPLPFDASRPSSPSTMTNAGLHVEFYLERMTKAKHHTSYKEFNAILDCYPRKHVEKDGTTSFQNPALRLIALGGDQFARLFPSKAVWVPADHWQIDGGESQYIYVNQSPVIRVPDIVVSEDPSNYCRLIDVWPPSSWIAATRTLGLVTSRRSDATIRDTALAKFKYQVKSTSAKDKHEPLIIEVSVGVRSKLQLGSSISWDCWCYFRRVSKRSENHELDVPAAAIEQQLTRGFAQYIQADVQAAVETVHTRNRSYFSLSVSNVFELDSVTSSRSILEVQGTEIGAAESRSLVSAASLMNVASRATVQDTWQSSLGVSNLRYRTGNSVTSSHPSPVRIRSCPTSKTDSETFEKSLDYETFSEVLAEAISSGVTVESSAVIDPFESYFSTLLIQACIKNDTKSAAELLRSPLSSALVEIKTSIQPRDNSQPQPWHEILRDFRAIHWASALGHLAIVRLLTDHGADPSSITGFGLSAVHLAAIASHAQIVEHLLSILDNDHPEWFENEQFGQAESPAHLIAAYIRGDDAMRILTRLLFDPKAARKYGSNGLEDMGLPELEILTLSLRTVDSNESDSEEPDPATPGQLKLPLNALHETLLHRAAAMDNIEAVKVFLDNSEQCPRLLAYQDVFGRTPVWHAAAAGAVDIVKLFLKREGVEVIEQPDNLGRTPLHAACRGGHIEVVDLLLRAGANAAAVTNESTLAAAHFAALSGNEEILLLSKHTDRLDIFSERAGLSPLHIAVSNGFLGCVKILHEAGANLETMASHRLIVRAHPNIDSLDVSLAKKHGYWSLDELAQHGNHTHVQEYLIEVADGNANSNQSFKAKPFDSEFGSTLWPSFHYDKRLLQSPV